MSTPAPILSQGSLLLRPLHRADIPALVQACNNETTRQWIPLPHPYTAELAEQYIVPTNGAHIWAFCDTTTLGEDSQLDATANELVPAPICGTIDLRWTNPDDPGFADIGYHCFPSARGKGLTTAALRLVIEYALASGVQRLELRADAENTASRRVAEKAGFTLEGILRNNAVMHDQRRDTAFYSIIPSDAENKPLSIPPTTLPRG